MIFLPPAYHRASASIREAGSETVTGVFEGITWSGRQVKKGFTPIGDEIYSIAHKTVFYVKHNWRHLVAYLLAWAAVVVSAGAIHGFTGVALPLTIGITAGLGFGLIVGIMSVKVFIPHFDPSGKKTHFHTLWNFLNWGINKFLDTIGTRQIMLSLAVAVVVTTATVFPYVMGGLFGMFMGNQIAYAAGMQKTHGATPEVGKSTTEQLLSDLRELRSDDVARINRVDTLLARVESLEQLENERLARSLERK